jgi:hypothetical protein
MSTPYIPAQDGQLDTWANNFQTVIAASPATYGLVAGDGAAITAAYNSYHAAYTLLTSPATRNPTNVAAKDVAKANSLITFRTYAQIIQNNAGVSNGAKSAAGITVRSTARTPIPAPATIPIFGVVSQQPGLANLGYADSATPTTKAKPFGAIQVELWYDSPSNGTPSLANATYTGDYTKSPLTFDTPAGLTGRTIGIWGRWKTRRGLTGPFSAELAITGT